MINHPNTGSMIVKKTKAKTIDSRADCEAYIKTDQKQDKIEKP